MSQKNRGNPVTLVKYSVSSKKPRVVSPLWYLFVSCWFFLPTSVAAIAPDLPVVGWIEDVLIESADIVVQAKLDTGADKSSLDARNIEEFEKDGKKYVRFEVRNRSGQVKNLELEAFRTTSIRRVQAKPQKRLVVRMPLCLAGHKIDVDITLVDRSNLTVPMLVGRNFLAGNVIIDPSKTFLSKPACQ